MMSIGRGRSSEFRRRRVRFLMRGGAAAAAAVLTLVPATSAAASERTTTPHALARVLGRDLQAAGGSSSGLVVDERTGQTLWSIGAAQPRLPASVQKLYTTTAALFEFGPDATLTTRVYGVGTLVGHTWHGTLYLRGGGDPTFGDAGFDAAQYGQGATVQSLAAAIRSDGIRALRGAIVGDESWFDSDRGTVATGSAPSTELEGQLSGLSYDAGFTNGNEDALQPHPTLWATRAFASALGGAGVHVARGTRVLAGFTPAGARLLATVESPTIAALIALTNAPSDNFFAETLLKDIGARFGGGGTTARGARVVASVIRAHLGLTPRFDDGSGLSRDDRTTAQQVVSLLRQMQGNVAFMDSLAVAGVAGTMSGEMLGTPAVGNCRGKTGTLHDVANLVGFCTATNGDQLVFAFLMNGLPDDSDYGHLLEDRMGVALSEYDAR